MKKLYSMSKTGKITEWSASLAPSPDENGWLVITISSGYVDGKKILKHRYVKSGKNLGKKNETSLQEQATLELERLYTKQYDKGYKDDIKEVSIDKSSYGIPKPMLAAKYQDSAHRLSNSLAVQPKIDGLRCLIQKMPDGSVRFTSRSGKIFTPIPVIESEVKDKLNSGDIMDGELYIPGKELQEIMSVIAPSKNIKPEQKDVQFYWYDFIPHEGESLSFEERFINCSLQFNKPIVKLKTVTLVKRSPGVYDAYLASFVDEGYEGLIIRDILSPYYFGRRHVSLQKYKMMESDEFEIVDIVESEQDESPRFVCDLRNGNTVTVRLKGDKEQNMKYLTNKDEYIGQWLTINYQKATITGSLQFPVGVALRPGTYKNGKFIPAV